MPNPESEADRQLAEMRGESAEQTAEAVDYLTEPMPLAAGVEFARALGAMPYGGTAGAGLSDWRNVTPEAVLAALTRLSDYLGYVAERATADEAELGSYRHERHVLGAMLRDMLEPDPD